MLSLKLNALKKSCISGLFLLFLGLQVAAKAASFLPAAPAADEPPVTLVEVRYEKLMRIYLNKIKLAFSETDDARSLEILDQFLAEFSQRTDGLKNELKIVVAEMSAREAEILYNRLSERSHTEELVALLFDERVATRMAANNELKVVMDQLHAKSLEVERSEREFIAAGK